MSEREKRLNCFAVAIHKAKKRGDYARLAALRAARDAFKGPARRRKSLLNIVNYDNLGQLVRMHDEKKTIVSDEPRYDISSSGAMHSIIQQNPRTPTAVRITSYIANNDRSS